MLCFVYLVVKFLGGVCWTNFKVLLEFFDWWKKILKGGNEFLVSSLLSFVERGGGIELSRYGGIIMMSSVFVSIEAPRG